MEETGEEKMKGENRELKNLGEPFLGWNEKEGTRGKEKQRESENQ